MLDHLSAVIRYHRGRAKLTQSALARLAGVGKTVVSDIERGKETVRLSTFLKVLATLNIQLDWQSPLRQAFLEQDVDEESQA